MTPEHISGTEVVSINGPAAAAKISTAAAVVGLSYFTLNEWVQVLTILFLVLQIILLIPKYYQVAAAWAKGKKVEVEIK